jgi:hypothetical protein
MEPLGSELLSPVGQGSCTHQRGWLLIQTQKRYLLPATSPASATPRIVIQNRAGPSYKGKEGTEAETELEINTCTKHIDRKEQVKTEEEEETK